ncbi:MAG TPA: hypothetical protein VFV34_08165 [Blastocatellia bacterium]|nr:hypothetical protein [Blastocatellia bacterium]
MAKSGKMICPDCGAEMNHHADKIDYAAGIADPAAIDPAFDGVVQAMHCCPGCGRSEVRPEKSA